MKYYIKKFESVSAADGYVINNIPFTSTVVGRTLINLTCNLENKKIEVDGDNIIIVNNISKTKFYLQNGDIVEIDGDEINQSITAPYKNTLVRVEIGDNVRSIGSSSFYNFSNLSHITIPSTVTEFGQSIFYGTNITEPVYTERSFIWLPTLDTYKTYTVPSGIEFIEPFAITSNIFENITIPDSVTELRYWNFVNCDNLKNVKLSDNLTYIPRAPFSYIYIENNIKYLDTMAVGINSTTNSVTIKNGTKYVCIDAFSYKLSSITIPSSVKYINSNFMCGDKLTNVYITDLSAWCKIKFQNDASVPWYYNYSSSSIGKLYLNNTQITDIIIPNDVINLSDYTFYMMKSLNSITFHNQMKSIGAHNFYGCKNLRTITIPPSIEHIGSECFYNTSINRLNISDLSAWCNIKFDSANANPLAITKHMYMNDSEITNLVIPNDVTKIGDYAFYNGISITSVSLHNNLLSVGEYAFYNCPISTITLPESVEYVGYKAFNNISTELANSHIIALVPTNYSGTYNISSSIKCISPGAFENCTGITTINIPNTVETIGHSAFAGCTNLTTINIPNSITEISASMFNGCTSLTTINIPNSVKYIYSNAFADCTSLTTINIPNSVKYIDSNVFANIGAPNITIPDSVEDINPYAFYCGQAWSFEWNIQSITVGGVTYEINEAESIDVILANGKSITLYIWAYYCFMPGTQITLADRTTKAVEDITYNDELLVWNFDDGQYDTTYPMWISKQGTMDKYYKLTLEDGTVLRASGANTGHKIYNVDDKTFQGIITIEVGKHVYTETGIKEIIAKECIKETTPYYNLMTDRHINCFAEGILTSMRYNNIYPFGDDMKFIKDGREPRPYSEFEAVGISKYWYDGLRLAEQTDSVEKVKNYIDRLENKMLPRE